LGCDVAELDSQGGRVSSEMNEILLIDGRRYRVVYEARGQWVFLDGKTSIDGIGFLGVVPA
jgi:hypothetical protein